MTQQHVAARPKRKWANLSQKIYPYISILPVAIVIALFALYPIIHAVRMSFYQYLLTRPDVHPFESLVPNPTSKPPIASLHHSTDVVKKPSAAIVRV